MKEEKFHLALKWYTQGILDAEGDIGDGIDGDFYDQYGDQFADESQEDTGKEQELAILNWNSLWYEAQQLSQEVFSKYASTMFSITPK